MNYLLRSFSVLMGCSILLCAKAQFTNPINIPDTLNGTTFNLVVDQSSVSFLSGNATTTYGINGDYLGPVLFLNKGDLVTMNVTNNLADTTTMHWHGMHVAPQDDGGPHTPISPGNTWSPQFTVLDEASIFWYHPHLHKKTAEQVYYGAAGMIIVRDTGTIQNQLPHTYGVDDFPLIIQDKSFNATTNEFIYTELADTMMVNGTLGGYLEVPAQMVRFRILNASLQRVYNIGFPAIFPAYQIGSDGGLLEQRVNQPRLRMAPGERIDVVVDFSANPTFVGPLIAFNSEMDDGVSGGPGGPGGGPGNPLDGEDFAVLEFRVQPPTPGAITTIPTNLTTHNIPLEANADRYRTKIFTADTSGFPFYINGSLMDMMVIDDTVKLDDIEVWTLINLTDVAHPWHIHDIQFYVLDINGNPPPPGVNGRKDVILVEPYDTIRYITQFTDFADETTPYMFHCHNLFHEDGGMMGQFIVSVTGTIGIEEWENKSVVMTGYPNPTNQLIRIKLTDNYNEEIKTLKVMDASGNTIYQSTPQWVDAIYSLDMAGFVPGIYFVQLITSEGATSTLKVIKTP